jgi:ABC-type transport system involved in cytochrome c biogenesis ATPase subunit
VTQFIGICERHRAGGGLIIASTHTELDFSAAKTLNL